jgi:hypothetical protein
MVSERTDWQESGREPMSRAQQKLLNAACDDLSKQLRWRGRWMSKDSWRHFFAGTLLGHQPMPGWDYGDGRESVIYMPRSSLELSKSQATEAITMAFFLGDCPWEQDCGNVRVRWCEVIVKARWFVDEAAAA